MKSSFFPKISSALAMAAVVLWCQEGVAQSITMTGPSCVTTGAVYLYAVSGKWDSTSTVRFCVTGGTLVDSGGTCAGGYGILSFVQVSWDSGGQRSGSVVVTTPQGNDSISVVISQPLSQGMIDTGVLNQSLDTATTPAALTCAAPTGGGCSIAYSYQWQQSSDNVIWRDIDGATSTQLGFSGPLSQTTYYRRLATNTISNAFGYSNVATISIPMQFSQQASQ